MDKLIEMMKGHFGFVHRRTKGSHATYKKPQHVKNVTIPIISKMAELWLIEDCINNTEITNEQYFTALK